MADYPAWKRVFDEAARLRRAAGERHYQALRHDDGASQIVHFSEWTSLAAVRCLSESPQLVEIRRRAGVRQPVFRYLELLEAGRL